MIEKETCIFVEGRFDKLIIDKLFDLKFPFLKNKIQIYAVGGKNSLLNYEFLSGISGFIVNVKNLLLICDVDENRKRTIKEIEEFVNKLQTSNNKILNIDYIILPEKDYLGNEIEDYLWEVLKRAVTDEELILYYEIESFFNKLVSKGLTLEKKKKGKKLLFSYLLLKDNCKYDGINIDTVKSTKCLGNVIDKMFFLEYKIKEFLKKLSYF